MIKETNYLYCKSTYPLIFLAVAQGYFLVHACDSVPLHYFHCNQTKMIASGARGNKSPTQRWPEACAAMCLRWNLAAGPILIQTERIK